MCVCVCVCVCVLKGHCPLCALDSYGLLGPSGCGKTTLLRCIVGLLKADSGSLLAMGDVPGARHHSVPGPMVGYMPQVRTAACPVPATTACPAPWWATCPR